MSDILNQALFFIGAAVLFVPLFHRMGFGSVLGYLVAGLVVGPYGFKLIKDLDSVAHVSELGVVLLLFVIGLEIQPRKLWSMKNDLMGIGGTQIFFTTLVFGMIAMWLGYSPTTSFVLAFGMSLSSTAFAVQTLTANNNFNTVFGKSSFSVLLMQDLIAIPALAIIPSLGLVRAADAGFNLSWLFPVLVIGLVLASRYLIQPVFRIIARTNQREIFTITALFVVLGVAMLMLQIGLSAALGTFIAGVLLADSEYRHELEANIEPFKSLFLGLFFIAVGMTVSLDLIVDKPFLTFGVALLYLTIKILIIYGTGRLYRLSHLNAKFMSLTIAQGGEFAFVIFSIAMTSQIAEIETLKFLTAIITISMALNPILAKVDEKLTQRKESVVEPQWDEIKDEAPEVIIAGFGRFGQMFGRILKAQKIPFVAIDQDADQIELLRKFRNKVYYGNVLRLDILEAAGIKKAKYFILAIDDVEASVKSAKLISEHFPHVKIFARARNRGHAFDLFDLGIKHVKRETFDSSVFFVGELLKEMGVHPEKARTLVEKFREHDEIMMMEQYKVRDDDDMFMSQTRQSSLQLSRVLEEENSKSYISFPTKESQG